MSTISFVVTSWQPDGAATQNLVDSIVSQGVDRKLVHVSAERISRPISLNRAIARCQTDYVGFCESDVVPSTNAVSTLERLLDRNPNIGLAAAKVESSEAGLTVPVVPERAPDAPDDLALEDISGQMWTLNFVLYRKSTNVLFDEAYFGNQIFDWDFGLELRHHGYSSVVDARCAVRHPTTDYAAKSLSYHVCVARNHQIMEQKWWSRESWKGLDAFQSANPGVIPTIEELTHATEEWQYRYIAKHNAGSLQGFYFDPRFGDRERVDDFLQRSRRLLQPAQWDAPVLVDLPRPAGR